MKEIMLGVVVLFCALQNVTKKSFNVRTGSSGGTFFFAGLSSLFAMLFFIFTADKLSFNPAVIPHSIGFGISYATSLIFGYLALTTGPASLSSLISSYSLLLPTFYGLIFLKEDIGKFFIPGLLCLIVSLFLINKKSDSDTAPISRKWGIYVLISFIGGGMCSVTQKIQQVAFDGNYKNEFMIMALIFVLITVGTLFIIKERQHTAHFIKIGWFTGISCGIMNGVVNLFVMILTGKMNTSVMFPIISAGSIIITHLFFRFLYKEKLSKIQLAGFILGTVSVILLNI